MKVKIVLFAFLLMNCFTLSFSQEGRLKYFGIEGGTTFIESDISNKDYLRGDMSSYYMTYSAKSISSWSYKSFVGVKLEMLSLNDRFGLFGGIRFSHINSSIGKRDYITDNSDYFYWRFREDGVNTEYLKINEINQKSNYVGIPIELRFYTAKRPRVFQLYLKLGIEINYLLTSKTEVVFNNPAMRPYEDDIVQMLDKPDKINSAVYGGIGFKLGKDQKPSLSLEACMPYINLTSRTYGIVQPLFGGGFQLNLQIPIKSRAK